MAATADIVFLVDESASVDVDHSIQDWVKNLSSRIETKLELHGFSENRFGLMAYGGSRPSFCNPSQATNFSFYFASDEVASCNGHDIVVPFDGSDQEKGVREGTPRAVGFKLQSDDISILWTNNAEDITRVVDSGFLRASGGRYEDGWWAVDHAAEGRVVQNLVNPDASPIVQHDRYDFRENAAVHFVLLSDEPAEPETRNEQGYDKILDELLTQMGHRRPQINDELGILFPEAVEDSTGVLLSEANRENAMGSAVLTSVVPTFFKPGFVEPADPTIQIDDNDPIFGIDADILDYFDVDHDRLYSDSDLDNDGINDRDRNGDGINDVPEYEFVAFVCDNCEENSQNLRAVRSHTDLVVKSSNPKRQHQGDANLDQYIARDTDTGLATGILAELNPYMCDGGFVGLPCLPDEEVEPLRRSIFTNNNIAQENFFSESYAFLTWETGGTVWDVGFVIGQLDSIERSAISNQNAFEANRLVPNPELRELFTSAVVDDIFEKIKLQSLDFDRLAEPTIGHGSSDAQNVGSVGASDIDLMSSYILSGKRDQHALFDLDQDGIVDNNDRSLLIRSAMATWTGDSNYDGVFTSKDLIAVFQAGEFEDGVARNSGWADGDWNGDLEFDSSDFVFAFQTGGYRETFGDFIDLDDDGIGEFLPVWSTVGEHVYRPNWS